MDRSKNAIVWAGLVLSILSSIINGIDFSFNVYAVLLKETFNFTQSQVELTASMGTVGMGLSFLETIITGRFGYRITFVLCWVLMPLGAGSMSLAALHKEFFAGRQVFIYASQLVMSASNCVASIAIVRLNVEMFPKEHTGKLIGIFAGASAFGKIVFAGLVELFFSRDLAGFFFTLSMTSLVLFGISFVVIHLQLQGTPIEYICTEEEPLEPNTNAKTRLLSSDQKTDAGLKHVESNQQRTDSFVPANVMLKSLSFHLIFWPSVLYHACAITCLNNITSVSRSAGVDSIMSTVSIMSLCLIIARLLFGVVFDKYPSLLCGVGLLSVSYTCFIAAMLVGMFSLNRQTAYLLTVLLGIGVGPGLTTPVSILMALFGKSHYGKVTVTVFALFAVLTLLIQTFVGQEYDSENNFQQVGQLFCSGESCFFWSFTLMLVISVIMLMLQWLNYALHRGIKL